MSAGNRRRIVGAVSYHGAPFAGWQRQPNQPTVQGSLEEALERLTKQKISVVGSGRTDAGVHGVGQVFHFDYEGTIKPKAFAPALNSQLPKSVRVSDTWQGASNFHARFSATQREYRYYITPRVRPLSTYTHQGSLFARDSWVVSHYLDLAQLNHYAQYLVGSHDFTALCAAGDPSPSKVKDIASAWWYTKGNMVVFRIVGRSFLWKMVRSIVGTSVEFARNGYAPEAMEQLLMQRNRSDAGTTAPAHGLYLYKVSYGGDALLNPTQQDYTQPSNIQQGALKQQSCTLKQQRGGNL